MNPLEQLQADITAKLNSSPYFSDVPVIALRPLTTSDASGTGEKEQAQFWRVKKDGTHEGCGVLVRPPKLRVAHPNIPGPQFDVNMVITVVEQPLISELADTGLNPGRLGKSAEAISVEVLRSLHQWSPDSAVIIHAKESAVDPDPQDKRLRAYTVNVWTMYNVQDIDRAQTPTVSVDVLNSCTISGIVSGQTAYYTVDGSFPSPQNTAALVYSDPFTVTSGMIVRAACYKDGIDGSNVAQLNIE
ncbi:conserved hypothetical protein [Gammaproteobacteria bacterium]